MITHLSIDKSKIGFLLLLPILDMHAHSFEPLKNAAAAVYAGRI